MITRVILAKEKHGTVCPIKTLALAAAHSANCMEIIIIVIADDDLFPLSPFSRCVHVTLFHVVTVRGVSKVMVSSQYIQY